MDYRLKKEKDFNTVFNKGQRMFSNTLTMIYLPSKELKAGYAVGKKHGGSVKRNRIKRIIREAARLSTTDFRKGFDLVFVWKNRVSADKVKFCEVKKDVETLYNLISKI